MIRKVLVVCLLMFPLWVMAQGNITGKIVDGSTKESVIQASVALLKADGSVATGEKSGTDGSFTLKVSKAGKYKLRITYVGYETYNKDVTVGKGNVALGTIAISPNSILLEGAEITGQAKKVVLKEDTFVYNASAYRTPEGSAVEELVKRIPGAEVSDDGAIKINGKEVKKIYVQGKEFFNGDTKTALKNIPTSVVDQIKAYDEQSDLARITGIDDGEETTVLDIGMKRGMNKGHFGNIDLSIGTEKRYAENLMLGTFTDNLRVMGFAGMNNVNNRGFGGGGGRFGGGNRNGDNSAKNVGVNVNYDNGKKNQKNHLTIDGSVRHNHSDGDAYSKSSSESFVGGAMSSFNNSIRQNYSKSNSWNGQARLEWAPDTMTNILFRPSFSWSDNDGRSWSSSATFNEDPYKYATNPLDELDKLDELGIAVNGNMDKGITFSDSKSLNGELQFNRKFGNKGRNFTLRLEGSTSNGESRNLSLSDVELFQRDSAYYKNRWNLTPNDNWSYSVNATYSEPIFKATFLQFSYRFNYRYQKSDRSTYDYGDQSFLDKDVPLRYRGWNNFFNAYDIKNPTDTAYLSKNLSKFSEYKNYIHTFRLMLRVVRNNYNLNVGATFTPQNSTFTYKYQNIDTIAKRSVFNWAPQLNFRYRFSKVSQLRIQYRGNSSQPSMTQLLPITDDSNPLSITMGNPDLKPSFSQNFRLFYNNYITNYGRAIMANVGFTTTSNSISNMVTYDPTTGGTVSKPENINGDWNTNGGFMFNTALDSAGVWNINTFTNVSYSNYVGYLLQNKVSQKNTTRSTNISERLAGSMRNDWLEIEVNGNVNYSHTRNVLQPQNNLDTWNFSYGASFDVQLPWGTRINTSMDMNSRRGYNDENMNTNELIWNAQISQGFLTGKPLTVMLQFYDILKQQSSFSRTVNAMQRSDTEYNSVNSYVMLHVVYRFNLFGDKETRKRMKELQRTMPRGGFPGGMPPGGMPPGGFGGGGFGGGGGFRGPH